MTKPIPTNKIDTRYILVMLLAVISSWLLHEFSHWIAGELLGNKMGMTLNKGFPLSGAYLKSSDYTIVSAAGPMATLLEAFIIFFLMKRQHKKLLYPILFTCFYVRSFATVISLRNPNDEARISKTIGLGTFTLPIIITTILFVLIYNISNEYKFSLKFNLLNLALAILFSSVIILSDQFFKVRII